MQVPEAEYQSQAAKKEIYRGVIPETETQVLAEVCINNQYEEHRKQDNVWYYHIDNGNDRRGKGEKGNK
jgi:hypothetical protein